MIENLKKEIKLIKWPKKDKIKKDIIAMLSLILFNGGFVVGDIHDYNSQSQALLSQKVDLEEYKTIYEKVNEMVDECEDNKREEYVQQKVEELRAEKAQEKKNKFIQVVLVIAVFGMLLAISYREISIMEMFNQKKDMESQLAVIEKENGQVQKNIKEEESKLDWNEIKKRATEEVIMI